MRACGTSRSGTAGQRELFPEWQVARAPVKEDRSGDLERQGTADAMTLIDAAAPKTGKNGSHKRRGSKVEQASSGRTGAPNVATGKARRNPHVNAFAAIRAAIRKEAPLLDFLTAPAEPSFDSSELPANDNTPEAVEALLAANRHYRKVPWPAPFGETRHHLRRGTPETCPGFPTPPCTLSSPRRRIGR
jgi:hypothetical protein